MTIFKFKKKIKIYLRSILLLYDIITVNLCSCLNYFQI